MKKFNKALITISVLIVASLSTAAVSTLAWFNVNRSVSMNYSSITINGNYGHLRVSIDSISDPKAVIQEEDGDHNGVHQTLLSSESVTKDVSSKDGRTIYRPDWMDTSQLNGKCYNVKNVTGDYHYYTLFRFSVTNPGTTELPLFLCNGTSINPVDKESDADVMLSQWTRVSVLEVNKKNYDRKDANGAYLGECKMVFEKKKDASLDTYIDSPILNTDRTVSTSRYSDDASLNHFYIEDFSMPNQFTPFTSKQYMGQLAAQGTRYYYGVVWLEGTEMENQDACQNGSVSISLSFAGIDPSSY